jgi:NTE family protein
LTAATGIGPSFFDGLADEDASWILAHLDKRTFEPGEMLLAEGDAPSQVFIVESGELAVHMSDDRGEQHLLNRVGPGASLGEMSLFTGRPVSATVSAASEVTVFVMTDVEFRRFASMFPRIYENLGAAISQRLVDSNRKAVRDTTTRVTAAVDAGAPPILAYALASSIAWHTAKPSLLITRDLTGDLAALAGPVPEEPTEVRAYIEHADDLNEAVRRASGTFANVVVMLPDGSVTPEGTTRTLRLAGPHESASGHSKFEYTLRGFVTPDGRKRVDAGSELKVAPFTSEDDADLRNGVLTIESDAGKAVGIAARDVSDTRVGIALGGGAIRGWAHIGVIAQLERVGVPIDAIVGTSIGAIVASSYAFGHAPPETEEALYKASAKIFKPRLPRSALLSNIGVARGLISSFKDALIEDTVTPLCVTATDIIQQREVVLRKGLLWEGAMASASIPGVFPPMRVGPYMLVDGGVVNPVPSNVLVEMGCDIVIGVKLTRAFSRTQSKSRTDRIPRLLDIFTSTFELMQSKITTETAAASTLLIEPTFTEASGFGLRQFPEGRKFIPIGEAAVDVAMPRLATSLPWLRGRH